MKLSFLGGAGEVTGSCTLVETGSVRFLVDCGMFQGGREAQAKNLNALDFELSGLDFVLLTHAHIDHSGLLPRLTSLGYKGPIYVTSATAELLEVMLLDSAHLQEREAERLTRRDRARKRRPVVPLYTVNQAGQCLRRLHALDYDTPFSPHPSVRFSFRNAGHILGSAIVDLHASTESGSRRLVFSGDLGHGGHAFLNPPAGPFDGRVDALMVESTYGDRLHKSPDQTDAELVEAIAGTLARGNVIIPCFAVGRTQEVLYALASLVRAQRLPALRVYIDSPMAARATEITRRHPELLHPRIRDLDEWIGRHPEALQLGFTHEVAESMALNEIRSGAIIISASGMCDAGRIKHHLRWNLPRAECTVLITGFQAQGTLGRRLVDGARRVRIFGEEIAVRAGVHTIGGLSAHADRNALLAWLRGFASVPMHTFVVHGEASIAEDFAAAIRSELSWSQVDAPARGESVILD